MLVLTFFKHTYVLRLYVIILIKEEIKMKLYIVIPCFNEEEVIFETSKRLNEKLSTLIELNKINKESKIVYVDDGSKDNTWAKIKELTDINNNTIGLKLSRNRGHQNALLAGLMYAKEFADCVISMDADLQDDINAIDSFLDEYNNGNDIVYGVRKKRIKDSFFKRTSAQLFYKFMLLMGVDIIYNHADYRLMSRRSLNDLSTFGEVNLFLRGIIPLIGYRTSIVYYERNERFAGESKYPLKKMISFAFEGITSFSIKPIRFILLVSFLMFFVSILIILYSLYRYFIGATVTGWTFLNISLWLVAGVQTMLLGIVGEYIGKIYSESKHRPKYIIEEIVD